MKRLLTLSVLATCAVSLISCGTPQPEVHHHHYHSTTTRYVSSKPAASVSTYKPAGVSSNAPETFEAVTPPSSYSR